MFSDLLRKQRYWEIHFRKHYYRWGTVFVVCHICCIQPILTNQEMAQRNFIVRSHIRIDTHAITKMIAPFEIPSIEALQVLSYQLSLCKAGITSREGPFRRPNKQLNTTKRKWSRVGYVPFVVFNRLLTKLVRDARAFYFGETRTDWVSWVATTK